MRIITPVDDDSKSFMTCSSTSHCIRDGHPGFTRIETAPSLLEEVFSGKNFVVKGPL
jgi:hypothetical protein